LDSAPTEEVYGSVFKFKNCTLSQFEVGAPTDYEVVSCPATTMFGGLQCEFEESTIFMATPSMFILKSGIGETRHGNSFTFKNCMLFNAVEGSLSSFYITDASLNLIHEFEIDPIMALIDPEFKNQLLQNHVRYLQQTYPVTDKIVAAIGQQSVSILPWDALFAKAWNLNLTYPRE
jgi:hypothetical protein